MVTTPNMGLVLPDEGGSLNVWGALLDTIFGATKIDGHDHSTGKGVKVTSAGLNINADLTWSSHAATDLLAVDFAPSASTLMTGFAGALFLSDGTGGLSANELYWRTTGGVNVKVTAGASLNVVAFTGGIGGDYAASGALVIFDDATDSYWFQQQLGAAVRQYARMRSADVDLYEFKANPAAGVPVNRVRLASPAALGASYALTMPAAAPVSLNPLWSSSAGVMTFSPVLEKVIGAAAFAPESNYSTASLSLGSASWAFGGAPPNDTLMADLGMITGDRILSITWFFDKGGSAANIITSLETISGSSTTTTVRNTNTDTSSAVGVISVLRSGINYTLASGDCGILRVVGTNAAHRFYRAVISYDRG